MEPSPTEQAVRRRRHPLFIAIECVLLFVIVAGWPRDSSIGLPTSLFIALCMWHIVAIPICILYLIGKPVVMTLDGLWPSAECRAFREELRQRRALSDAEFCASFSEGIEKDVPARLRRCLSHTDDWFERLTAKDFLYLLDDDLDLADVMYVVEREFKIRFTEEDRKSIDGTMENLSRLVIAKRTITHQLDRQDR